MNGCEERAAYVCELPLGKYRQFSDTTRTQSQNITVSRLVLRLSLPNPLKPSVRLRVKMKLGQRPRRCSNFIWVINNFIAYLGASYIRDFTVDKPWVHGIGID